MSSYRYEWASPLFDWMRADPETLALVLAAGCVLGFAVVIWELFFYLQYRACWMQVRTLAGRRRVRKQRDKYRALVVGALRRRLARLEALDAD
jgi:hypothetical protein